MNLRQITLIPPVGDPITLGSVTYTNGQPAGYTLTDLNLDAAPRTLRVADLPLVPGGIVAPGLQTFRTVTLAGTVVGADATEVQVARAALISACADRGGQTVTIRWTSDGATRELYGYLDGAVEFTSTGSHFLNYALTLVCPDPTAVSATVSSVAIGATTTNIGSAPVWPTFTVELTGTVSSVKVGNTTTGEYLQLDGLPAGDELIVATKPGFESVLLDGVSVLQTVAVASRFPALQPGANSLYVTVLAGGGTASGTVSWRSGWSE